MIFVSLCDEINICLFEKRKIKIRVELLDPTVSSDVGSEIFIVLVAEAISADNLCIKRERKGKRV